MLDLVAELKELRLHGMVSARADLQGQDDSALAALRLLVAQLRQAEHTDLAMRSVSHLMSAAKFPLYRDLAGFDSDRPKVDQVMVRQLATMTFTDTAQNAVLTGGPGTGKRTWRQPSLWRVSLLSASGFAFTPRLTWSMCLSGRSSTARAGRLALTLLRMDSVILDELGYGCGVHFGPAQAGRRGRLWQHDHLAGSDTAGSAAA